MSVATLPDLETIAQKVYNNERLSLEDGMRLFETEDLSFVMELANHARKQKVGDVVYFASTLFIHPTNLCELSCPFCSFYAKPSWESAWMMSPEDIRDKVAKYLDEDLNEVHFVGGLWKDCNLEYYEKAFGYIRGLSKDLHIKALDAIEHDYVARLENLPLTTVLEKMVSYGMDSIPGGGAEVLVEEIRKKIAPQKITTDQYLEVHRTAHQMKIPSNVTMLFGHIEENRDLLEHMIRIRELQDETGGFQSFVPLLYHPDNNPLGKRKNRLKPKDPKRVYAIARLMLDNVYNIKVLWNYLGIDTALEILDGGGNDLASTAITEKIIVMAGGVKVNMTKQNLQKLIEEKGRIPKHVNSGHNYKEDRPC